MTDRRSLAPMYDEVLIHRHLWQREQRYRDVEVEAARLSRRECEHLERLACARLTASQARLEHRADYLRLSDAQDSKAQRLLVPDGQPALRRRYRWEPAPRHSHRTGRPTVDVFNTLKSVEDWFGIPDNGRGQRAYDTASGRALATNEIEAQR